LLRVRSPFTTFNPPGNQGPSRPACKASVRRTEGRPSQGWNHPAAKHHTSMRRPEPENDDRKKRWKFGQNFLVDESVVRQIAEDVAPRKKDWVIEIGPGAGAITRRLAAECDRLTAIEIDPKWIEHLRKHPEWGNLDVVQADATRVDVEEILAREPGKKPLVVGNLPYNRAAPASSP
jgi:hypothetical protein